MSTSIAATETAGAPAQEKPRARAGLVRVGKRGFLLAAGFVGAIALGGLWFSRRGLETTDNAQVDAELLALASRVSGVVVKVSFEENQPVKEGDVLVELDEAPAKARLEQAQANLDVAVANAEAAEADAQVAEINARGNRSVAEASLHAASAGAMSSKDQIAEGEARVVAAESAFKQAATEKERAEKLVATGAIGRAVLDQAITAHDSAQAALSQARAHVKALRAAAVQASSKVQEASARAEQAQDVDVLVQQARARARAMRAQVATAKAARDLAALDLSYTKILAPQDGIASKKNVTVGQTLSAGSPIVQIVPSRGAWITANFKETQLERMRPGQPVEVHVDSFPDVTLRGELESLSAATGAKFALLPPDNASGNFTKIVQRVPARVRLLDVPSTVVLRPGMSAEIAVDTRK